MNKELKDITITVCATQDTVESDSFNNTYDANATYPVVNVTELKEALSNGGVVAVTEDIQTNNIEDTAAARIVISQPTTLNLEKKIITPDNMGNNNTNFCALIIDADTTINAGKDGGIDTGVNGGYGVNVRKGAAVTINDGYYYGGGTAVPVSYTHLYHTVQQMGCVYMPKGIPQNQIKTKRPEPCAVQDLSLIHI